MAHDRLEGPSVSGFVVSYQAANAEQSIREEIPQGETVERWSRMVTTQWMFGVAERITPVNFTKLIVRNMRGACPGGTVTTPHALTISGRPAVQIRADCPRTAASDRPEIFILLVVGGERDLMVRQVAFRRVPSNDDLTWSTAVLGGTVVCQQSDNAPPYDRID